MVGVIAGERDLSRAAAALASRVPERLGVLARLAYNYRWSWAPGGAGAVPRDRPRALGARRHNPVRLLQEASTERAAARRGRRRAARARRGASSAASPRTWRARRAGVRRRSAPVAFFCAEYGVHALAADLLRRPRRAGRRHPQGGLRPRAAAGRRGPDVPPGLLPPAHRRDAAGSTSTGSTPIPSGCRRRSYAATTARRSPSPCRSAATTSSRRSGASTSAACRCSCSTPTGPENAASRAGSPRGCTSATPRCASRSTCCSASAACRRSQALGIEPGDRAPQRGPRGVRWPRAGARERPPRRGRPRRRWRRRARRTVFTTHTPVPAGNDTYPAGQVARGARAGRRRARHRRRGARPSRAHAPRRRARAVRRHAVRAARQPRAPTASARATARSRATCGAACGPTATSTTCRSRT